MNRKIVSLVVLGLIIWKGAYAWEINIPVLTIALEAQGESLDGQIAVGEVIRNRAKKANKTFNEVCLAKYQFSCWNGLRPSNATGRVSEEAYQRASRAWEASEGSSLTKGATHYYAPSLASPKWVRGAKGKVVIGGHTFLRGLK